MNEDVDRHKSSYSNKPEVIVHEMEMAERCILSEKVRKKGLAVKLLLVKTLCMVETISIKDSAQFLSDSPSERTSSFTVEAGDDTPALNSSHENSIGNSEGEYHTPTGRQFMNPLHWTSHGV
jgi:hypothetical protein